MNLIERSKPAIRETPREFAKFLLTQNTKYDAIRVVWKLIADRKQQFYNKTYLRLTRMFLFELA